MDICFKEANYTFNFRVAALIKNGNKILVEKNNAVDYYGLVGGRCKLGEDSIEALIREIKEETGEDVSFIRSVGMLENFFISRYTNSPYHEILIIHELEFINKEIYQKDEIINLEEECNAKFYWREISSLDKCKPKIVFEHLNDEAFFHLIVKDEKIKDQV